MNIYSDLISIIKPFIYIEKDNIFLYTKLFLDKDDIIGKYIISNNIKCIKYLLKIYGNASLIYNSSLMTRKTTIMDAGLMNMIKNNNIGDIRYLLKIAKQKSYIVEKGLILFAHDNNYSKEIINLLLENETIKNQMTTNDYNKYYSYVNNIKSSYHHFGPVKSLFDFI